MDRCDVGYCVCHDIAANSRGDRRARFFESGHRIATIRTTILSSVIVLVAFAIWRPLAHFPLMATNRRRIKFGLIHFDALRSGERMLITWRDAEGLITFPSFHTTWAILMTIAFRRNRWLLRAECLTELGGRSFDRDDRLALFRRCDQRCRSGRHRDHAQ